MGNVDDLRKLLQDLVTPDLKALDARVVALEQKLELKIDVSGKQSEHRDDMLEKKIDAASKQSEHRDDTLDKKIDARFDTLDKKIDVRFDTLDKKIDTKFDTLSLEIRSLASVVAANQASIMHALDMDRRVEKIEREIAAKTN